MTSLDYLDKRKEIDPDRKRGGIMGHAKFLIRKLEEKEENASNPHTKGEQ